MTTPAYANVGTRSSVGSGTSVTPALPGSRVNGNILICIVGVSGTSNHSVSGSGWQALGSQYTPSGATFRASLWWRVVDGSEGSPTVSWTGSAGHGAQIFQITRANFDTTAPFGAITANAAIGIAHSNPGLTTTRNNSGLFYCGIMRKNASVATSLYWSEKFDNGSATGTSSNYAAEKTSGAPFSSGYVTGSISMSTSTPLTSSGYVLWMFEVFEPKIGGTMAPTESGSDTASISGTVAVSGALAATESGDDTSSMSGTVAISGTLDATDSGDDIMVASGTVTDPSVTGTMDAVEVGDDTFDGAGNVLVSGVLDATDAGDDTFAGSGTVPISGVLAAQEIGDDIFAGSGTVAISGALDASEAGDDTFAGSGAVAVSGSLAAQETGEDVFAGSGIVRDEGAPIEGTMAAVESGSDTFAGAGTVEQLPLDVVSRSGIELSLPVGTKRKKPKSTKSQLEEAVRRALGRFPGKRSKPPITAERLQEAAEAILNMPHIPQWEFERVAMVLRDILGQIGKMATPQDMVEMLLELAEDTSIDEDDEELIELLMTYEVEYIMSL
jgi:hypothetical protein